MRQRIAIALGSLLALVLLTGGDWWLRHAPKAAPAPAPVADRAGVADFRKWAVVIVAGDNRAHSGAPSQVFDDARRDLTKAFIKMGFAKSNIEQFSMNFDADARPTDIISVAEMLKVQAKRAPDGCLIYFTSHGAPSGIIVGPSLVTPVMMSKVVDAGCGQKPAVVVMSACYSGQFVPALMGQNRIIMSAARPDRTSFGCGEMDKYTYFDDCFLRAIPQASDFAELGDQVKECVATREQEMNASPPSEPQVKVGESVVYSLRWK